MSKSFGDISLKGVFGGWSLADSSVDKIPQDLASAIPIVFNSSSEKVVPAYFFGSQIANGTNYALVCKRTRSLANKTVVDFVSVVINVPAKTNGYKEAKLVKKEVAGETILTDEAEKIFYKAVNQLVGVEHKPLIEVGTQIVKGLNFHFICQSKTVVPEAVPYLTRFVINVFENNVSIVSIDLIDA